MQALREDEKFKIVAQDWLVEREPALKEASAVRYATLLRKYVLPEFGDVPVSRITDEWLNDYAGKLTEHHSAGTAEQIINLTQRIRKDALPGVYSFRLPRGGRNAAIETLSGEEYRVLTTYLKLHADVPANLGILLCLTAGLKPGELCALSWEDVSLQEGMLHIRRTMQRVQNRHPEETAKTRIIISDYADAAPQNRELPLPDDLRELIAKEDKKAGFFLTGEAGHFLEPRTMENRLRAVCKDCGIASKNFTTLRDTFAVRNLASGKGLEEVSRLLGHASVSVTEQRYGAWRKEQDPCGGEL